MLKFLALQGAPFIYDISRLRVNTIKLNKMEYLRLKIIGLADLGYCFVSLKPHIFYYNILLRIFTILYYVVKQKYLFGSEIHRIAFRRKLNL
jgi:hypothetical protein